MRRTFTRLDEPARIDYDAQSWTEGQQETTTIEHTNTITLTGGEDSTSVHLQIAITGIGPKAKMAAFGMKFGYKSYLDKLEQLLAST